MALVLADRVRVQSTTTGTGTLTLGSAYTGYVPFSGTIPTGSTVFYCIHNTDFGVDNEWEVGYGTYTTVGDTLSRDTVYINNSGTTSKVSFSAGTKEVFITQPAERAIYQDNAGNTYVPNLGAATPSSGAFTAVVTPTITASTTDLTLAAISTGAVKVQTAGGLQAQFNNTASTVNYFDFYGSATGSNLQLKATGSDTNIGLALTPKGNGALQGQKTDSTVTGGNARGQYSVDWQMDRTAADQVASGNYCTIGGGTTNKSTSVWGTVGGGNGNTTSQAASTIAGGYFNNCSGGYGAIAGGASNTASGSFSAVGGGFINTTAGAYSSLPGGYANATDSSVSTIVGGSRGKTRGIIGNCVIPATDGPVGGGASGVVQKAVLVIGKETTDATPGILCSNGNAAGTTNQIILPNNSAYYFKGEVVAGVTGGGNTKGWFIEGVIKRGANAASTALVGTPTVTSNYADAGASTWTLAVAADTTNGGLKVTATGQSATTIRWVANVTTTEMAY